MKQIRGQSDWELVLTLSLDKSVANPTLSGSAAFDVILELKLDLEAIERMLLPPADHDPARWGRAGRHLDSEDVALMSLKVLSGRRAETSRVDAAASTWIIRQNRLRSNRWRLDADAADRPRPRRGRGGAAETSARA